MFATRGSPSKLAVLVENFALCKEPAGVAARAPRTGRSRRPGGPALAGRSLHNAWWVTRRRSLSEPTPYTQTASPRRPQGGGSPPDMGSWNTQAAREWTQRRVTRNGHACHLVALPARPAPRQARGAARRAARRVRP